MADLEQIAESLSSLTVMEAASLVKLLEEKWGVSAAAPVAMAAVAVPGAGAAAEEEQTEFEVVLAEGRECCGRPAFSRGLVDEARRLGEHNVPLLEAMGDETVVFLEPSCYSMFVDEYLELEIPDADRVAARFLHGATQIRQSRSDTGTTDGYPTVPVLSDVREELRPRGTTQENRTSGWFSTR